jgi:hypothetical protein
MVDQAQQGSANAIDVLPGRRQVAVGAQAVGGRRDMAGAPLGPDRAPVPAAAWRTRSVALAVMLVQTGRAVPPVVPSMVSRVAPAAAYFVKAGVPGAPDGPPAEPVLAGRLMVGPLMVRPLMVGPVVAGAVMNLGMGGGDAERR